jgi:hypothetical protein
VEIEFEASGKSYKLVKRFSGPSGTASLTELGGATWQGEEAEAKLAEALGVDPPESRGGGKAAAQQWSHLWVAQGESSSDPVPHANACRTDLFARLQEQGGSVVMLSERDASVAAHFRQQVEAWYTSRGVRANTELDSAAKASAEARRAVQEAHSALQRLDEAVRNYSEAGAILQASAGSLEQLQAELIQVTQHLDRLSHLRQTLGLQEGDLQRAVQAHEECLEAEDVIARLRGTVSLAREALAPREEQQRRLLSEAADAATAQQGAAAESRLAETRTRTARLRTEAARAQVTVLEKQEHLEKVRRRHAQAMAFKQQLAEAEQALARLPLVDAARLKTLVKHESALHQTSAALRAMAAGIEVLVADQEVRLGGVALRPGETKIVTEDAELTVGSGIRLRLHPGGGQALAAARNHEAQQHSALQTLLDGLGIESVTAASEVLAQRQALESEIKAQRASLAGLGADRLEAELLAAEQAVAGSQAEMERRLAVLEGFEISPHMETSRQVLSEEEGLLRKEEAGETAARKVMDQALQRAQDTAAALQHHQAALEEAKDQLRQQETKLALRLQTHGDDASRTLRREELLKSRAAAQAAWDATRAGMAALQPDLLESDRHRLQQAIARCEAAISQAKVLQGTSEMLLRSEGNFDPRATLALAEARLLEASQHEQGLLRRGAAFQLLDKLFQQEQQALTDQFTKPLAEKISGYLQCLFGPEALARVVMGGDNQIAGLELVRPSQDRGSMAFEVLSGGAREQVAAALRLAMAEVLASGQADRCLPVVFDDAFAWSDPERVRALQRMLDLAARRGLQVVVLTCNPADYAGLGAHEVRLRPPLVSPSWAGEATTGFSTPPAA